MNDTGDTDRVTIRHGNAQSFLNDVYVINLGAGQLRKSERVRDDKL